MVPAIPACALTPRVVLGTRRSARYFQFPLEFQAWPSTTTPILTNVPPLPARSTRYAGRYRIRNGRVSVIDIGNSHGCAQTTCTRLLQCRGNHRRPVESGDTVVQGRVLSRSTRLELRPSHSRRGSLAVFLQSAVLATAAGIGLLAVIAAYIWRSRSPPVAWLNDA